MTDLIFGAKADGKRVPLRASDDGYLILQDCIKSEKNSFMGWPSGASDAQGEWDWTFAPHISYNIFSDQPGYLYIEIAIDDACQHVSFTRKAKVKPGRFRFDAFVKAGRPFRVRFIPDSTAPSVFFLRIDTGSNLFPYFQTNQNTFSNFGKTISGAGTTWYAMIDLSDTDNYDHLDDDGILIGTLSVNIDKTTNAQGSVSLGVITRIDADNADVTLFFGKGFANSAANDIEIYRNFEPSAERTLVRNSAARYIKTTAVLTNQTGLQNDTAIESYQGAGTVTPAVGDIVARYVLSSGTSFSAAFQIGYRGECVA